MIFAPQSIVVLDCTGNKRSNNRSSCNSVLDASNVTTGDVFVRGAAHHPPDHFYTTFLGFFAFQISRKTVTRACSASLCKLAAWLKPASCSVRLDAGVLLCG